METFLGLLGIVAVFWLASLGRSLRKQRYDQEERVRVAREEAKESKESVTASPLGCLAIYFFVACGLAYLLGLLFELPPHQPVLVGAGITLLLAVVVFRPILLSRHLKLRRLMRKGRMDEALELAESWVERNTSSADAHEALGGVLSSVDRYEEAIEAFQRAIDRTEDDAVRRRTRLMGIIANVYCAAERLDEALNVLDRAIEQDAFSALSYIGKARVLMMMGRLDEAKAARDLAVSSHEKDNLEHVFGMKKVFEFLDRDLEAAESVEESAG